LPSFCEQSRIYDLRSDLQLNCLFNFQLSTFNSQFPLLSFLSLTNFKSHQETNLDTDVPIICLVGDNGVGKTNILEAIYLLCLTKSRSGLLDKELVKQGGSYYRVQGKFQQDEHTHKVVAKYEIGKKKAIELDGNSQTKFADYIGKFPVVMITPDDTELVTGGSEERRKLLDTSLSQVSRVYLDCLSKYQKLIEQRNQFLKNIAKNQLQLDQQLLETLNEQLVPLAETIHRLRSAFISEYAPLITAYYNEISGEKESISCTYQSNLNDSDYLSLLQKSITKDLALERTTEGIHKDDLQLLMNGTPIKKFGSQGQLKSLILSLRLAQFEMLRKQHSQFHQPILLLDDIFDKLDEHRVKHLIHVLLHHQIGQIFITDTHLTRVEDLLKNFDVEKKIYMI
jgi:DNA replication and repair protein RecF